MFILMIFFAVIVYGVLGIALIIFIRNYSKIFLSMFSFRGTMNRKDFWKTLLIFCLTLPLVLYIIVMITEYIAFSNNIVTMAVIMWLMIPWAAAICRRLNDAGILGIIRYILIIPLFVFFILASFLSTFLFFCTILSTEELQLPFKIYQQIYPFIVISKIAAPVLFIISLMLALLPSRKKQ